MTDQQQQQIPHVNSEQYSQKRGVSATASYSPMSQQQQQVLENVHQSQKKLNFHQQQQWKNPNLVNVQQSSHQYSPASGQQHPIPITVGHQQQFVCHQTTSPESQQHIRHSSPIVGISPPAAAAEEQRQQIQQQKVHYMQQIRQPSSFQMQQTQQQSLQRPPRQLVDVQSVVDHQTQQMVTVRSVPHLLVESSYPGEMGCPPSNPQQQLFNQPLAAPPTAQPAIRIRQSSSLTHMHPAPPPPPPAHHQQQQRILVHQQNLLVAMPEHAAAPPPPPPPIIHPSPYIGSQRFLTDMDSQNFSPKKKYRDLKKKFKYLVYENEYYQEELRNLQRKLLKLSRDKNFLLDRLGQYENLSESSDDSDASAKTLEDRGTQKQKRKQKQAPSRKRAAPNPSTTNAGSKRQTKAGTSKKKAELDKDTSDNQQSLSQAKIELKQESTTLTSTEHIEHVKDESKEQEKREDGHGEDRIGATKVSDDNGVPNPSNAES